MTDVANRCRGLRKNKEGPRDNYVDDAVWQAARAQGGQDLRDALDLAYLRGQRPNGVVAIAVTQIVDDMLQVCQGMTKFLRIDPTDRETGERTELGRLVDEIRLRPVAGLKLLLNLQGKPLTRPMLRTRFEEARRVASVAAAVAGDIQLAERITRFQIRDSRPKAASEIEDIAQAQKLLGHSKEKITRDVYRRVEERVKPTRQRLSFGTGSGLILRNEKARKSAGF